MYQFLCGVDVALGLILEINSFLLPLVLFGKLLCILPESLDLVLGEFCIGLDGDLCLLLGSQIFCRDIDYPVCVDVKFDLDLGHSPRCGQYVGKVEASQ